MNNLDKYLLQIVFSFLNDKEIYIFGQCSKKLYKLFEKEYKKRIDINNINDINVINDITYPSYYLRVMQPMILCKLHIIADKHNILHILCKQRITND